MLLLLRRTLLSQLKLAHIRSEVNGNPQIISSVGFFILAKWDFFILFFFYLSLSLLVISDNYSLENSVFMCVCVWLSEWVSEQGVWMPFFLIPVVFLSWKHLVRTMERVREKNQVWQKQICMKSPLYRHPSGLSIFSLLQLQGPSRGQETQRLRRKKEGERKRAMSDCGLTERLKSFEHIETKPKFWTLALFPLSIWSHSYHSCRKLHISSLRHCCVVKSCLTILLMPQRKKSIGFDRTVRKEDLLFSGTLPKFKAKIKNESVKRKRCKKDLHD